jgi:hypothetical protein
MKKRIIIALLVGCFSVLVAGFASLHHSHQETASASASGDSAALTVTNRTDVANSQLSPAAAASASADYGALTSPKSAAACKKDHEPCQSGTCCNYCCKGVCQKKQCKE